MIHRKWDSGWHFQRKYHVRENPACDKLFGIGDKVRMAHRSVHFDDILIID